MDTKTDEQLAKILWDYNLMHIPLEKADAIMVMGSHDIQVADRGVELFKQDFAPLLIMSGGLGRITQQLFHKPEGDLFADRAISLGVPKEKILIENKSSNTSQNVEFTRHLLQELGIVIKKIIVVHKPYMERRAYATFKKVWPQPELIVTSPQISFADYKIAAISRADLINIIVGDTQRLKIYSQRGFQTPQDIPAVVWQAYEELIKRGYTKHLAK